MAGNTIGEAFVAIRPDTTGFEAMLMASVTSAVTQVQAAVKPINIPVDANLAPLVAQMAVAGTAADAAGGGGGTGIMGRLLWGAGGAFGFAAFGSILSLAGFGFEHVVTTMIGLAGSFAGALGGLAVLAIGVFGKMAVGMGSDMLVMKSVIADTQTLGAALTAIQVAQVTYGVNSAQAAAATQALNVQMILLGNTAGVQAELGLAKAAQTLNHFWDQATSAARVAAVGFIMPFFAIAYTYIPLIAAAATKNFTLMTAAFKPFIAWATGPGTAIFKNLENLFAASIPIGVAALTNFVELLAKVANWAAPQTGGIMVSIEKFLAYLNSTAGFAKLEGVMTTMVGMFHDWWDLLKQIAITIYDLFSQGVGLGTSIVKTITAMLVKLDAWLTSTSGKNAVHTLFAVHLQEVLALLAVLPTLLGAFGKLYLTVAPDLTLIVVGLANAVGWMLKVPVAGNILAWALAIGILAQSTKIIAVTGWLVGAVGTMYSFAAALFTFATSGAIAGSVATALGVALNILLAPVTLIAAVVAGFALIGVGLYLLLFHFKEVTAFMSTTWGKAFQIALAVIFPWIALPLEIILHWQMLATFFHNLPGIIAKELGQLPSQIGTVFSRIPGTIVTVLTKGLPAILGFWLGLAGHILGALAGLAGTLLIAAGKAIAGFLDGLAKALPTITKWFIELPIVIVGVMGYIAVFLVVQAAKAIAGFVSGLVKALPTIGAWFLALPGTILKDLTTMATFLINVGISVITGFLGGIGKSAPTIWSWFLALPGVILSKLTAIPGCLLSMGEFLITGFLNGIVFIWKNVGSWFSGVPGAIGKFFVGAGSWLYNIGKSIIQGLLNGIISVWNDVKNMVGSIGGWITSHKGPLEADAVLLYPHGQAIMQGFNAGLKSQIPSVLNTLMGLSTSMQHSMGGSGSLSLSGGVRSIGMGAASSFGAPTIVQTLHFHGIRDTADVQRVVQQENRKLILALRSK